MLILASQSPRRKKILKSMNIDFKVVSPDVEEYAANVFFEDVSILNAKLKAENIAELYPETLVLSADTVIEFDGRIFSKPINKQDAETILLTLSGKTHKVITSVCIIKRNENISILFSDISKVTFKKINKDIIKKYMKKVNVMDKAGAYALQDSGDMIIESVEGSISNIIGLPIEKLLETFSMCLKL